ncbi:hypothetical protein ACIPC1_09105 [Streptomyces sp. NPDC087263]|uniref:hypothetical protein n=1 Tax=Streptomyces sp. NPDC087263 TaxID=3365773 RepID=UPI00381CC9BF
MVVALLPTGVVAADACDKDFGARLKCWSDAIGSGDAVLITLDDELSYDGKATALRDAEKSLWNNSNRKNLTVEVPKGGSTGEGGTVLLLLAGTGWIAQDTTIDKLPGAALKDPENRPVCGGSAPDLKAVCDKLAIGPLSGRQFLDAAPDTYGRQQSYSVASDESGSNRLLILASALLVILLAALVVVIRRSSRAAPGRALAAAGGGTIPTAQTRVADEQTTHLRTTPSPRYGRRVGNVPGPAKSAVVRTELHPQGYVELDRVLYRAVWAEPGRPPPAPGGLVDVTDARERDSDVLYAFPPTTGRHAKGARS